MTKNNSPAKVPYTDISYVINNLPPKDLKVVDDMDVTTEHINNFLEETIENGGSFKFSWDFYSDCPQLTLTFGLKGFDNSGYAVSARGKDFEHCVKILMYKYFEVAQGALHALSEVAQNRPKYG